MHSFHIGTMGWSYDFWKGSFYPENLPSTEFLAYYSSKFDTVEVDYTFYRIPRKETMISWKKQTPRNFVFSLKFPRIITHIKMLENCEEETSLFLEHVELLDDKLGPLLLQFPPSFGITHIILLEKFLKNLPKKHYYAVEVRNNNLFEKSFFSILQSNNIALAWTDSVSMPTVTEISSNFIYIRWEGDRKTVSGTLGKTEIDKTDDINKWTKKLQPFMDKQMNVFGYFSKYYSGNPTLDSQSLLNNLSTR